MFVALLWMHVLSACPVSMTLVVEGARMITSAQMRAARALLNIDQRLLAELSGLSLPTIQRMEASEDTIRGNVDSLMKLISALDEAGVELINDGAVSHGGGRGVRFKETRRDREALRRRGPMSSGSSGPRAA
jgi:transcriptional regulator with XRE-family HTH domain